ncbi:MAG: ATP-dependent RecD-like DNA helicase, partial [Acutalibacteraceae bacterium]
EQATGRQAHTIHRLLEYGRGEENEEIYGKDEDNPLETDVVIVDEMSMVDTFLMWHLLRAIPQGTRVVLIGDIDQLPSVGPGHVLHDLIESALFPVTALDTIFRQGEGSAISLNARRINRGEMPSPGQGFEMWQAENPEQVWRCLQTLCKDGDWQVITPMKKGESGVIALNGKLQALINPADRKKPQFARFGQTFRLGDQVMQIRNDYQQPWTKDNGTDLEHGKGVFNGELGVIVKINPEAEMFTVQFDDDRISDYDFAQTEEMTLSYAISIHKSQGSEFDRVAIALLGGTPMLYNRNLLYTAVTRAKKQVVLIGRKAVVQQMINNNRTKQRYSGLTTALQEAKQNK